MFARIAALIRKDLRVSLRDNLSLYILVSPLLLGLLMVAVLPIFEDTKPMFVVSEALAAADREALEAVGEVEVLANRDAVVERVLGRDDATGVVPLPGGVAGEIEAIIEGDEPEVLRTLAPAVVEAARSGTVEAPDPGLSDHGLDVRSAATALLAFSVPALMSLMVGFTILEEKTTRTIEAYAVAPLRFVEYLVAKLGLVALMSIVLVIPAVGIVLGFGSVNWLGVVLLVLAALPFAASYGLLVGAFAKEQLGAIAMIKSLSPPWTSLPILGFVLSARWMWTQWPFANHWAVQGFFNLFEGDTSAAWQCGGLALAAGLPVLGLSLFFLARRLGFSRRG